MAKPKIQIDLKAHPEQFFDKIREFESSERDSPSALESLLYEISGHRCTICNAPWVEIHHIKELKKGGKTKYDNLIVLCPNCHTRVHLEGKPSQKELKHYKLKQELALALPVYSKLKKHDKELIKYYGNIDDDLLHATEYKNYFQTQNGEQDDAKRECMRRFAPYLQQTGVIDFTVTKIGIGEGMTHRVDFTIKLTSKGIGWMKYLKQTNHIEAILK